MTLLPFYVRLVLCSVLVWVAALGSCSPAFASEVWGGPGDAYVFPAQSPVAADGNSQQSGPAVSGSLVFWSEYEAATTKSRIFFKDLSQGSSAPGKALIENEYSGGFPAVSQSGNRVVWSEMIGSKLRLYYRDADADGGFSICPGTVVQCAMPVASGYYWQEKPAISPDGSKVAWENGRGHDSQIHLFDFESGTLQEVWPMPDGDQIEPSLDEEWIVWTDWRNYNSASRPVNQRIYARKIGSPEPPLIIADNEGSIREGVGSASMGRNLMGEPEIVYVAWEEDRYGTDRFSIMIYNLSRGTTRQIYAKAGRLESPHLDRDKLVWLDCSGNPACDVMLHDLSTGVTQIVSQDASLGASDPVVDRGTGNVVWRTTKQVPAMIYHNRIGDTAQQLADKHAPHLYLHRDEYFEPRQLEIMVDGEGTELRARNGIVRDDRVLQWPDLRLADLGAFNTPGDEPAFAEGGKYLDLPGNLVLARTWPTERYLRSEYVDRYDTLNRTGDYPVTAYAHIVKNGADGQTAIQYWLPYYFDNWNNYHEGDWEHVDVILNQDLDPVYAALSQHDRGQRRPWDYVEGPDSHPMVYVARGSHANYFFPGAHDAPFLFTDDAAADRLHTPAVAVLPDVSSDSRAALAGSPFYWLAFQGAWGELSSWPQGDGPQGPAASPEHASVWDDPFSWFNSLCWDGSDSCDREPRGVSGSVHSPVDIHLYDSQGRHVGKNAAGGIDREIPDAEYIEIADLHEKNITVHGADGLAGYRFVLTGTGEGTFDFTVTSPDRAQNSSDTVNHIAVPVTAATLASLMLDQDKDYSLEIDADGDGTFEERREPDSVVTSEVDLNPPAPVRDLHVTGTSSGSAMIVFTAPGDDGDSGMAQYYDIRYSTLPITQDNWREAVPLESIPAPAAPGSTESVTATGLLAGTVHYFAAVARDEALQSSGLSNITTATTTIPDLEWTRQKAYWASLQDYQDRRLSVDFLLGNRGTGPALAATIQSSVCHPGAVLVTTALPWEAGDIDPGSNQRITLNYHVPASVFSFTINTSATCNDDAGRIYRYPAP